MGKNSINDLSVKSLKDALECVKKTNEEQVRINRERWQENLNASKKTKKKKERKKTDGYVPYDVDRIEDICFCKPMYEKILEMGWSINRYWLHNGSTYRDISEYYEKSVEKYECSHNGWVFMVDYLYDCDIEPGIWRIYGLKREGEDETLDWYCDLGCCNTSEDRLQRFLEILSCSSKEEYIEKAYGKYRRIPELFEKKFGISKKAGVAQKKMEKFTGRYKASIEEDISPSLNEERMVIRVMDGVALCYLVVFSDIYDKMQFVVTNNPAWDANSSNTSLSQKIAYYLEYNGPDDLDKLCDSIDKFRHHMEGEIGFLENGKYVSNRDIHSYFYRMVDKVKVDNDSKYLAKFEYHDIWDMRGYAEEHYMPNLMTGLQIYSEEVVRFTSAESWVYGSMKLAFVFVYDKNKHSSEAMTMHVYSHPYSYDSGKFKFKNGEAEKVWDKSDWWHKNSWDYAALDVDEEYTGKPSELLAIAKEYIKAACESLGLSNVI